MASGWSTWSDDDDNGWDGGNEDNSLRNDLSNDPVLNQHNLVLNAEPTQPDPDFGGEWRPRGRLRGKPANGFADESDGRNDDEDEERRRSYRHPRPPRRDCNVDFGLNKRRGGNDNSVFVRNLPWQVFEQELDRFFSKFGRVKTCQVIRERAPHHRHSDAPAFHSKGYGFVKFEDEEGMNAALQAASDDLLLGGRQIVVTRDRGRRGEAANSRHDNGTEAGNDDDAGDLATQENDDGSTDALSEATSAVTISDSSSPPTFDHLPEVVVVRIFDCLSLREKVRLERVSKRWQRLARLSWASITEFVLPDYPGVYSFRTMIDDRQFMK